MKNLFFGFILIISSVEAFAEAAKKDVPNEVVKEGTKESSSDAEAPVEAPTESSTSTHTIKMKKKPFKLPGFIAPANTTIDANCADRLGKGDSGYTACEAGKRTR